MHAYFCSIIRKRVGMKREAGTKEERRNRCYIYLGCRRSWLEVRSIIFYRACPWKERNPKASFFLSSSIIHPITEQRSLSDTKNIRHFRHCPTIVRYLDYLSKFSSSPLSSWFHVFFCFFFFSFFFFQGRKRQGRSLHSWRSSIANKKLSFDSSSIYRFDAICIKYVDKCVRRVRVIFLKRKIGRKR